MKLEKDETIYKETWGEKIGDYFIFLTFVATSVVVVLGLGTLITIIGFEIASAIWGEYTVIYWLADLF